MSLTIPIETSARHIHITQNDFEILFGEGAKPTFAKELSQPGQYACKERLTVLGPKGRFEKVVSAPLSTMEACRFTNGYKMLIIRTFMSSHSLKCFLNFVLFSKHEVQIPTVTCVVPARNSFTSFCREQAPQ